MTERTFTLKVPGILGALMYLAFGLAMYMWLVNYETFSWTEPLLYVYMALWPLILLLEILSWILIGVLVFVVVLIGFTIWDHRQRTRYQRMKRRANIERMKNRRKKDL